MISLVENEMLKLIRKKRFVVILLVILFIISIFTYAQYRTTQNALQRLGTTDWRTTLQQQITDAQNRMSNSNGPSMIRQSLKIRLAQQQYYLDHNINPNAPGAPTFIRTFGGQAVTLLIPLLIMVATCDIVSSEYGGGTIKMLLTRPVRRWKILLSKYITMILSVSAIVFIVVATAFFIPGMVFGFSGWNMPVLSGFSATSGSLNTSQVHLLPQWQYLLMEYGLIWFVCVIVGTLSFMVSVLIRTTAAGMGVMLATLISGAVLSNMVSDWESAKYLFMINMTLPNYLSGAAPPIDGMTLGFSLAVLSMWGLAGIIISFWVFSKRDVY
ncbi:MAG TPA: ABC transporter permease [Bacillota bacterium]|nr:ABC transporter permease [Bacillota bacterium]